MYTIFECVACVVLALTLSSLLFVPYGVLLTAKHEIGSRRRTRRDD